MICAACLLRGSSQRETGRKTNSIVPVIRSSAPKQSAKMMSYFKGIWQRQVAPVSCLERSRFNLLRNGMATSIAWERLAKMTLSSTRAIPGA